MIQMLIQLFPDNDELMVHFNHPLYVAKDGKTDEVEILLTESETIWLFDMPDVNLTTALEDLDKVVQRNKEYLQVKTLFLFNEL